MCRGGSISPMRRARRRHGAAWAPPAPPRWTTAARRVRARGPQWRWWRRLGLGRVGATGFQGAGAASGCGCLAASVQYLIAGCLATSVQWLAVDCPAVLCWMGGWLRGNPGLNVRWARTAQRAGGHPPPPQQLRSHQQHHSHPLRQGWAAAGARRGWATAAAAAGSRTRPLGARPRPRWSSWRRPPTSLPRTATSAAAVTMTCESLVMRATPCVSTPPSPHPHHH